MAPTSPYCLFEENQLSNLFDNLTPFVPETPIIKAKESYPMIWLEEMSEFKLDEESPTTKIKKIRRKLKRHRKSIDSKLY